MEFFDLHCDTPYSCFTEKKEFLKNDLNVSFEKGKRFNKWQQLFAIWVREETPSPFAFYKAVLSDFKEKIKDCKSEKFNPFFAIEGGSVVEEISCLEEIKNDGVKAITLTWNGKNRIASGAYQKGGLTCFGEKVIGRMNDLKIATDLSHLNEESFFDSLSVAKFPLATHSCCKAVFDHPRNLSEKAVLAIAEKGGVIGVCPYPEFSGTDSFEGVYKNVSYLLSLGLNKHIAFGSDFDGAKMSENLKDLSCVPFLKTFLIKKGIKREVCDDIFYLNAYNFFKTFDK